MAKIVPQYMPRALPKTFETTEDYYTIQQQYLKDDEGNFERDENNRKIKSGPIQLVKETRVSRGGILFTMPRGHSVRLTSPEQMKQFRVTENPRLVDLETGEEVNEMGIPKSLEEFVKDGGMNAGGDFASEEVEEK